MNSIIMPLSILRMITAYFSYHLFFSNSLDIPCQFVLYICRCISYLVILAYFIIQASIYDRHPFKLPFII